MHLILESQFLPLSGQMTLLSLSFPPADCMDLIALICALRGCTHVEVIYAEINSESVYCNSVGRSKTYIETLFSQACSRINQHISTSIEVFHNVIQVEQLFCSITTKLYVLRSVVQCSQPLKKPRSLCSLSKQTTTTWTLSTSQREQNDGGDGRKRQKISEERNRVSASGRAGEGLECGAGRVPHIWVVHKQWALEKSEVRAAELRV